MHELPKAVETSGIQQLVLSKSAYASSKSLRSCGTLAALIGALSPSITLRMHHLIAPCELPGVHQGTKDTIPVLEMLGCEGKTAAQASFHSWVNSERLNSGTKSS